MARQNSNILEVLANTGNRFTKPDRTEQNQCGARFLVIDTQFFRANGENFETYFSIWFEAYRERLFWMDVNTKVKRALTFSTYKKCIFIQLIPFR